MQNVVTISQPMDSRKTASIARLRQHLNNHVAQDVSAQKSDMDHLCNVRDVGSSVHSTKVENPKQRWEERYSVYSVRLNTNVTGTGCKRACQRKR